MAGEIVECEVPVPTFQRHKCVTSKEETALRVPTFLDFRNKSVIVKVPSIKLR